MTTPCWKEHGLFGGHLALDFTNTVDDLAKTRVQNTLVDWPTVLDWSVSATALSRSEARRLEREVAAPTVGVEFDRLLELRERVWRLLSRIAAGRAAGAAELTALSEAIRWAYARARLDQDAAAIRWTVRAQDAGAALVRARLLLSLDELLTGPDLTRLRECARCTGLFLNRGRGAGRRWCRMSTCGNRTKVQRFRQR